MIYTSYMANLKHIPVNEKTKTYLITRWKPKNLRLSNCDAEWKPELSPSETILTRYKEGSIDWKQYREMFIDYVNNNALFIDNLNEIIELDSKGYDVFLVCYEKDYTQCHRGIIKEILNINDIECEEYIPIKIKEEI